MTLDVVGRLRVRSLLDVADRARAAPVAGMALVAMGVVIFGVRRRAALALLLAIPGALWLAAGAAGFRDRVALAALGPLTPPVTWETRPAQILRQQRLVAGDRLVAVSPAGTSFVVQPRPAAPDVGAYDDDDDDDFDGRATTLVLGDFDGRRIPLDARRAQYLDAERLLLAAPLASGTWELREVAVAAPGEVRAAKRLPGPGEPSFFADRATKTVHGLCSNGGVTEDWIWSSAYGFVATAPLPDVKAPFWVLAASGADARSLRVLEKRHGPRGMLALVGPAATTSFAFGLDLACAAGPRAGQMVCAPRSIADAPLLVIDAVAGTVSRTPSLPGADAPVIPIDDHRVAFVVDDAVAVVDPERGRGTSLTFPKELTRRAFLALEPGALAVERTTYPERRPDAGVPQPAERTLIVLAPPRWSSSFPRAHRLPDVMSCCLRPLVGVFTSCVVLASGLAAGCDTHPAGAGGADAGAVVRGTDATVSPPMDVASPPDTASSVGGSSGTSPTFDAGDDAAPPPQRCADSTACSGGLVCLGGTCQADPCKVAPAGTCAAGAACQATCVRTLDPCAGKVCPNQETCVDGACLAGCFDVPCNGVTCPAKQFCDPGTGKCAALKACAGDCGAGFACDLTCATPSPCAGVTCPDKQSCVGGKCLADPCAGVVCPAGSECNNGTCSNTCACAKSCGTNGHCTEGSCVCTPTCPADGSRAGMDDGCTGTCACAKGSKLYKGACCTPACPANGSLDGMADGCGGTCPCPTGERLYKGACCAPACPTDGSAAGMADGCGSTCACPSGKRAYEGSCCTPNCPDGYTRGGMSDGCGSTCACASGETAYGGACCKPQCPIDGTCGGSNGCGGSCGCTTGGCVGGVCTARACNPLCGCGQTCNDGKCVAVTCDVDAHRCGCGCCNGGETCVAGKCVVAVPIP